MKPTTAPVLPSRNLLGRLRGHVRKLFGLHTDIADFQTSQQYWEDRYSKGGNSGAGSYGRLSQFKAEVINEFVREHNIQYVTEFGVGDGAQLSLMNFDRYVGYDISPKAIEICRRKFADRADYSFHLNSEFSPSKQLADLALSLDVIYHLIEDSVFEAYMRRLFAASRSWVIIYAYDSDRQYAAPHEKGRRFTPWIQENCPEWQLIKTTENRYPFDAKNANQTSQCSFFIYSREDDLAHR